MQINKTFKNRAQRGLTLIEASMVLALAAVVVAGAVMYYQSASDNNKIQATQAELGAIQSAVQSLYAGQPDYDGLAITQIAASSSIPRSLVKGTALVSPWGSTSVVTTATNNAKNVYSVTMTNIPQGGCLALAAYDLGTSLMGIAATSATALAMTGSVRPTATTAAAQCGSPTSNTVSWAFR